MGTNTLIVRHPALIYCPVVTFIGGAANTSQRKETSLEYTLKQRQRIIRNMSQILLRTSKIFAKHAFNPTADSDFLRIATVGLFFALWWFLLSAASNCLS